MPLPAAAAAAAKGLKAANAAKDLLGGGGQKKSGSSKKIVIGCGGCVIGLGMLPVLIILMIVGAITGSIFKTDVASAATTIQPMPDLCQAMSNPQESAIVTAAQQVVAPGQTFDCKKPDQGVLMLLSMAWVDSQWGTQWNAGGLGGGTPTPCVTGSGTNVAGFEVIAQALKTAGFTGSNLVMATAISGVESNCGTNIGPCTPNVSQKVCGSSQTAGCNTSGFCGAFQLGFEPWASADYLGRWGLTSNITQAALDLQTNAQYAFALASGGNASASQQVIYTGLYDNWVHWETGYPSNPQYLSYMAVAQQAVNAVQGTGLPTGETGIILMSKTAWASHGIADANNASLAQQEFQVVWSMIGPQKPPSSSTISTFYQNNGVSGLDSTIITSHVSDIEQVFSMAQSGGGYINPFTGESWNALRIDQGVDWGPNAPNTPVRAIGAGVVTFSQATNTGWPFDGSGACGNPGGCGGFIIYELTTGPQTGHYVYVGEHITNLLPVGTQLTAGQTIAYAQPNFAWTEWGWAAPPGNAQNPLTRGSGETPGGLAFDRFLISLGAPIGNSGSPGPGPDYP